METDFIFISKQAYTFKKAHDILRVNFDQVLQNAVNFSKDVTENGFNIESYIKYDMDISISIPMVMNGCFAIELFLKTLIKKDNDVDLRPYGHKLKKLFQSINVVHQTEINNKFLSKGYNQTKFLFHLDQIDDAFVEFRYIYEQTSVEVDHVFINDFIIVLDEYIRKIIC